PPSSVTESTPRSGSRRDHPSSASCAVSAAIRSSSLMPCFAAGKPALKERNAPSSTAPNWPPTSRTMWSIGSRNTWKMPRPCRRRTECCTKTSICTFPMTSS
ncbi:MAG: hypothetical protein KJ060_19225, partial [Candidatus Hydrogenedentes bacterium]|nr:hypothetical protein [Candidatus Hydrogenedentota bacterium]